MSEQNQQPEWSLKATKNDERLEASEIIHQLQESGDFNRLQEELLCKLLYEHPEWWEEMRLTARETVKSKDGGVLDVSLDELSAELIKTGMTAVPDEIQQIMMERLQSTIREMGTTKRR